VGGSLAGSGHEWDGDAVRVLITGCSSGFGWGAAVELTKRGHEVIATARRPEVLDELDVAQKLALDVDSDASVAAAVSAAGHIDALVNNAGWGIIGPVELLPIDVGKRLFETNFFGALRMMQAVLPQMRERGSGTIVNVTSVAGRVAPPLDGMYAGTKFALEGLSEALMREVGHFGINVALVEPGFFSTTFSDNATRVGLDVAPYDELEQAWSDAAARLRGGAEEGPGPEAVAFAIADIVESDAPRFRTPVGDDAQMVLAARDQMDDAAFEAAMRATLELDW
jgi:NAD(P)-dependent dehydrogenase (short-subunit alcohol dehydrogenase family)